ncbi:hypothetical protein AXF42_Ash007912 [Apostasia shenzhenica]|uniref:Uncharacterized protein n=1 Tax=Apostasia shenzhenica TaxID=1088818 RepID=A0A2I0B5P7_9ASPA|nr:hypothetical protein AXF42_Ash007912 [Apostasia shenzhenica]
MKNVGNTERLKYYKGRQRTIKMDIECISYVQIIEIIKNTCTWLEGREFELHFHVLGSSPKQYKQIIDDVQVLEIKNLARIRN